ncbi:MAG: hypothetical protein ACXWU5_05005 [Rhodoplanes sp.]|jgi:hypothetical protein
MMVKSLEAALAEVATLPEAAQEQIGRELLAHVEKLRELRADIEEGIRSLETEGGIDLDIEDVIERARLIRGKA